MTTNKETYTAVTSAHDGIRMVEISRQSGLDLAAAKRSAKGATITRDSDGARMILIGRKLVVSAAPALDAIVGEMERARSISMPTGHISQVEADEMAEDLGDYSHYRTR